MSTSIAQGCPTFEVGGTTAGVRGEIDYFLMGVLHKMY